MFRYGLGLGLDEYVRAKWLIDVGEVTWDVGELMRGTKLLEGMHITITTPRQKTFHRTLRVTNANNRGMLNIATVTAVYIHDTLFVEHSPALCGPREHIHTVAHTAITQSRRCHRPLGIGFPQNLEEQLFIERDAFRKTAIDQSMLHRHSRHIYSSVKRVERFRGGVERSWSHALALLFATMEPGSSLCIAVTHVVGSVEGRQEKMPEFVPNGEEATESAVRKCKEDFRENALLPKEKNAPEKEDIYEKFGPQLKVLKLNGQVKELQTILRDRWGRARDTVTGFYSFANRISFGESIIDTCGLHGSCVNILTIKRGDTEHVFVCIVQ